MRKLFFCLMAMMGVLTLSAQCELGSGMSVYDFTVKDEAGNGRVLKRYEPTDKMSCIEADLLMELNHR